MTKRAFDLLAAGIGLVVLAPVMAVIAVLVKRSSPGPVLFRQERVGRFERTFTVLKFRTMTDEPQTDAPLITAASDSRITPVGSKLRAAKLDELPQLVNVVRGEMSLVGPRPEVRKYVDLWGNDDKRIILSARPGITDPATLELRHEEQLLAAQADPEGYYEDVLLPQKIRMYREYVESRSLVGDVELLRRTLGSLFRRKA